MSIESVMPSNHLILCRPLLLLPSIFPSIRVGLFSNESALPIRWPKYWSFSFNIINMVKSAVGLKKVLNPEAVYSLQEIIIYVSYFICHFSSLDIKYFPGKANHQWFSYLLQNFSIKHIVPILQVGLILGQLFWSIIYNEALDTCISTGQVILL